ncbi:MAG: hypothetical protein IKV69_02825 [Clostridia bacterium]|nr:hypothetical protein [Clostridia bacterium]
MLSALLLLSLFLFLQNPFITNKPASSGLVSVGTPINISVAGNGSESQVLYLEGALLPNFSVVQDINITLKPTESPCAVRARVYALNEQNQVLPLNLTVASQWQIGGDGYCYCQETLSPNLVIDFLQGFEVPDAQYGLNAESVYPIVVSIETLPLSCDYQKIWKIE